MDVFGQRNRQKAPFLPRLMELAFRLNHFKTRRKSSAIIHVPAISVDDSIRTVHRQHSIACGLAGIRATAIAIVSITFVACGSKTEAPAPATDSATSASEQPTDADHGITVPKAQDFTEPVWNAWVEPPSKKIAYLPVSPVTDQDYSIVLNLAALAYRNANSGVYSTKVSGDLENWIKRQKNIDSVDVEIIVDLDRRFFSPLAPSERFKSFTVDLAKIRTAERDGFQFEKDVFSDLRKERENASFSFGAQNFKVHTRKRTGLTYATLFVWVNGRPIDEVNVPVCIRADAHTDCAETDKQKPVTLRGVDLSGKADYPDAALQFVERATSIAGVFRCNSCPGRTHPYYTWNIDQTGDWFAQQVARILTQMVQPPDDQSKETDSQIFERSGNALTDLIFDPAGDGVSEARAAFIDYLARASSAVSSSSPSSSLFVRLLPTEPTLVLAPLNVMHVTLPSGDKAFIGELVNVETPLEFQDYSTSDVCISDWTLFVPPEQHLPVPDSLQDVSTARTAFDPWITGFKSDCPLCLIRNEGDFQTWLENEKTAEQPTGAAVVMLSHQANNTLSFYSSGNPSVGPETILRQFAEPSIAILDACGTAAPGASEFIRHFNEHGISTVIATYTEVEPHMAGEFLTNLLDVVADHPGITIGKAKVAAVQKLRKIYGSRALAFTLAGNGSVRVCLKTKRKDDSATVAGQ